MTQKERQAQSRKEILQASLEEFGTVGYAQATVDSICARRHISKGMMYHYYKGKDDLFLLCAADMFEKLSAFLAAHESDAPDAQQSAFDGLAAYYQCREAFFAAHPVYWLSLIHILRGGRARRSQTRGTPAILRPHGRM